MTHPPTIHIDGQDWVAKAAYDKAIADLAEKQRSTAAHNRYFAHINDLYGNLPARHAQAPYAASETAFRKHGLIEGGFCDVETLVMPDVEAAKAAAPSVARIARRDGGYALVSVTGPIVTCRTPHSQSFKAMGKDRFHESVAACERWAEELLGVRA